MNRITSAALSLVLIGAVLCATATAAQAATPSFPSTTPSNTGMVDSPGSAAGPGSISVHAIIQADNNIWVGGIFDQIDNANGAKVADASGLAVFDATTGAAVSGVHIPILASTDGMPEVMDASLGANGVLYFAGDFDHVDGAVRNNVAAIDPATGALLPFAPNAPSASSILATPDAIFVGSGKLQSFTLAGVPTPGFDPPKVFINAALRGHLTIPAFRDIQEVNNTLVTPCQCDSLTDDNGTRIVKMIVEINATTGNQNSWLPLDPVINPTTKIGAAASAFGLNATIHNFPGTNNPTIYLASGGSDFTEAFDFSTGAEKWKTDTSGSSQAITWYQGFVIIGGHYNWTASPGNAQCQDNDSPNTNCYYTPKLVSMDASTGKVQLDATSKPWNPGICCRYEGVWALLTGNDGSTLHVGGEFDDAGGSWTCHTFQASCLPGKVLQRNYARFGGPNPAKQTLTVATAGAGSGTVASSPAGINCGVSCTNDFTSGQSVTLTATPQGSTTFTGWSSADPTVNCPGVGTCTVSMSQAHSVTATFAPISFQLTIAKAGTGTGTVTSSPVGITCGTTCSSFFAQNTAVTLTATPGANATFTGWTSSDPGFSCPGTGTCHVTMNQARTVTATFTPSGFALTVTKTGPGTGLITSDPSGINCGNTCTFTFNAPTVTLTAVPNGGWVFNGWTGAGCSGTGTCTVTMNAAQSVSADFETAKNLTVAVTGNGTATSNPAGISCPTTCSAAFVLNTNVLLTETPAANAFFTGWGGDGSSCGTSTTCVVAMTAGRSVTATFVAAQTLTVTPAGLGTGTVTSNPVGITCGVTCTANYASGKIVTLTATPDPNSSTFTGWSGTGVTCSGTGPCMVTMNSALNVTATFGLQTRGLTVSIAGSGTVQSAPGPINCSTSSTGTCTATYPYNTEVELSETPVSNWVFTGWSGGGCTGTDPTCVVPMTVAQSVMATFAHIKDTVQVTLAGNGQGSVTDDQLPQGINCPTACSASYDRGTSVTLTATPQPNYAFTGWSGDCTGPLTCVLNMTGAKNVTATFQPQFNLTVDMPTGGTVTSGDGNISCPSTCSFLTYTAGATVTLTATPNPGNVLAHWGGDCAGADPTSTCTITMDSDKDVSADLQPAETLTVGLGGDGSGTITSVPARINCIGGAGTCWADFDMGVTVTLTATPDANSAFTGWTTDGGPCPGTTTCAVTMDAAHSVTATFVQTHLLTVQTTGGTAGSVSSDHGGISCPGTCSASYLETDSVTLTADPGPNATFTGWTGGGCGGISTCTVVTSVDTTVTAAFAPIQDPVSISFAGAGAGSVASTPSGIACPSACTSNFNQGSQVTLTATPNTGSVFTGWAGDCTGTTNPCQVTVDQAKNVAATFDKAPRQLTVNVAGSGSVASDVGGISCPGTCTHGYLNGDIVNLTATPTPGFHFVSWSGGGCSGTGACQVTLNADTSVTATFAQDPQPLNLTVASVNGGTGSVASNPAGISCTATCSWNFAAGTPVTLTATPAANTTFAWSGDCSGSSTCQVTMSAAHNVTITFTKLNPQPLNLTVVGVNGGTGSVASSPAGISCTVTCSSSFPPGTPVTLTATPAANTTFAWSGDCSGSSTCQVTMSAAHNVTVTFTESSTTTIDDIDPAVAYNGWADVADAAANGGFYRVSDVKNDKATWKSPATTSITWITRTGPNQGKASLTIDGKNEGTVDLYTATPAALSKTYAGLTNKVHTVVIKVLHTKNAASSGFGVRLDAFKVGAVTTQESDPGIQYDTWKYAVVAKTNGGSWHSASAAAASATVTFTGTSIDWITATGKAFGKASVTIDGVAKGTLDFYTAGTKNKVLKTFAGLSAGTHTMVIQVLGTKSAAATGTKIVVDGFTIHA